MARIIEHIRGSIADILIFAICFAGIGYFVPMAYYQYFDKTQYYSVESPMEVVGDVFMPGDTVKVEVKRKALYPMRAVSVSELVLFSGNVEVARYRKDLSINLDSEIVYTTWELPEKLEPGVYFFRGVVSYKFRGMDKYTEFYTTKFQVIKNNPKL